ncbi:MAG: Wadjet anti-phage system protein JetD domain-containing protein, partial [Traorella sp.]
REFLQLLYQYAPHLDYYHFGDIDAGGIYIFEHLKEKTHIPFQPLWMDIKTLKEYHQQTIPLTKNDRLRLKKIESKEFQEVIQYMLQHNQKLEQENVITKLENIH